jgi:hypothetical protein
MTEQEFETIIKPLMLLDGKQCQSMRSALLGNFKKWNENKQLRIGVVVRSAVKETKTVFLDDTWHRIEIDGIDTKSDNKYEFEEILDILLTDKQKQQFTIIETNREFEVSQKRIDKMFAYINSDKNH